MTKELEQKITELENEISDLDSYIRGLEKDWDEEVHSLETELEKSDKKIIDLEYELFIEKTRDSNHKFYWFIANKIPFIADVSYLNNENTLFGFKDVPVYSTIEKYDLRFITNCSLDDLVEQYR